MLLTTVILVNGAFLDVSNHLQQVNADGGGNKKKFCNILISDSSKKCSHDDKIPFILPFP
jgi:hypothetical protein